MITAKDLKAGDTVRVIKVEEGVDLPIGTVSEVIDVDYGDDTCIVEGGGIWLDVTGYLELIEGTKDKTMITAKDLKVGDTVRVIKVEEGVDLPIGTVLEVRDVDYDCDVCVVKDCDVWLDVTGYLELVKQPSKYPNQPPPHWELRIEHAKGADIELLNVIGKWVSVRDPNWLINTEYRVKPAKTDDELRIEKLEDMILEHNVKIIAAKKELAQLKTTVHY